MKYPALVPDMVCTIPITVTRTDGLNRDGSPKQAVIFEGKCFYSEKAKFTKSRAKRRFSSMRKKKFGTPWVKAGFLQTR